MTPPETASTPLAPQAPLDARTLRNVLGCYATGVAVITARTPAGEHIGVTINSFASVSLAPPLILFSLALNSNALAHFEAAGHFTINILGHDQQALSNMFARPSSASWEGLAYTLGENGCALFTGSLAQLECSKFNVVDGGDHRIFLGEVSRVHLHNPADPLLFYRGRYGTYTRDPWSKLPATDGSLSSFSVPGWG